MKFTNKIAVLGAMLIALAVPVKAQTIDAFSALRAFPFTTNTAIAANALLTTNGPFDMVGYAGRGILIASAEIPSVAPAGTLAFKIETSPDTTNWLSVSNFANVTAYTAVANTNYSIVYNQNIFSSTNFVVTDNFLLPYTTATVSAPYNGFATPENIINGFTNAAGNTTVAANGTPAIWSVDPRSQQRYWHLIWTATGGATNGVNPSNAIVNATWLGPRIGAP